jgi:hypothetical protein
MVIIRFAKAIVVAGHSIACVLLAGYVFTLIMRFGHAALGLWVWVCYTRKRAISWLLSFSPKAAKQA